MTKRNDIIKIEVEIPATEALRSMVVLGRTNGNGSGAIYHALKDKLDPEYLFYGADKYLTRIDYSSVQIALERHFFGLYEEKAKRDKFAEILRLEEQSLDLKSRIQKLKLEIGE